MTIDQAAKEVKRLTEAIRYHNDLYYRKNVSKISDQEFDALHRKLLRLEERFPKLRKPDSPTQRVGGTITKGFATVRHTFPMLSLSNTYQKDDLLAFDKRIAKELGEGAYEYVCELKFDGVSISLIYEKGLLTKGVSRGDGVHGDDITYNVKTIRSVPLRIAAQHVPERFEVRGEVFLPKKTFVQMNREREANGEEPYANARNTASGTLKMQDSSIVAKRKLECYAYSLLEENTSINTHQEAIEQLKKWGFNVSETYSLCATIQDVLEYIARWERKKEDLPLEIDGIVIKINDVLQQVKLGATAKNPRWATAYKYASKRAVTQLVAVTYQVGRTGAITPVAELEPIMLSGTTVKRASLHNANEMDRLSIRERDYLVIEKGGEIIPKVVEVDRTKQKKAGRPILYIGKCPACRTPLIREEGEAAHYCPNKRHCPPQIKGRLEHFIHRDAMDISSLGEKTIAQLYELKKISTPADLYALGEEDLALLDGFKELSIRNALTGIEQSKAKPCASVLFALGIRHVGKTVAKRLIEHFRSIDPLTRATVEELLEVPEVGEKIAQSVRDFFDDPKNEKEIERLKKAGLQWTVQEDDNKPISNQLQDTSFVVSGVFRHYGRDQLKEKIKAHGGRILSGVSGKLNYLVAGDKAGEAKLKKAHKLGVKVISEKELDSLLAE